MSLANTIAGLCIYINPYFMNTVINIQWLTMFRFCGDVSLIDFSN